MIFPSRCLFFFVLFVSFEVACLFNFVNREGHEEREDRSCLKNHTRQICFGQQEVCMNVKQMKIEIRDEKDG